MKTKQIVLIICLLLMTISGCGKTTDKNKIGVSIAVMNAERWEKDVHYMKQRAEELGVTLEVNLSQANTKQQFEECKALIEKGISVLILTPSNAYEAEKIVKYAHSKDVKVISYDRVALYESVDLVITFDNYKVGEMQGKYLIETVDKGNYIVLSGDENDFNSSMFLDGAMKYINELVHTGDIQIVAQESIPKWSPDEAKKIVAQTLKEYDNDIQAILAPNDTTAKGCIEALEEAGLAGKVAVTGMDGNITAVKRILEGTQDITVFKDMRELAVVAVEQAVKLANGKKPDNNSIMDTLSDTPVITLYVEPKLVIKANIDKVLIESGFYTREEVYGE